MKFTWTILILVLFFGSKFIFSRDIDTLYEGKSYKICNKIMIFDGIWISEGQQFADITVLENENSKPITGGYKKYDKIEITGCDYYIEGIYKNGINPAGYIILSKEEPEKIDKKMFVKVELTNNDRLYSDDPLSKVKIYKESGKAAILTGYMENNIEQKAVLKKGSVIWYEGYPFELVKISLKHKIAEFLIMKSYSYGK